MSVLLSHLLYPIKPGLKLDKCHISTELGSVLANHPAHNTLYHIEFWPDSRTDTTSATLWGIADWNKYVECGCNLTAYWEYKHGEAAKLLVLQQQQAFAQLTPKQKLKLRIAEELAKGNYIGVAMMERTLKYL